MKKLDRTIGCFIQQGGLVAEVRLQIHSEKGAMTTYENTYIKLLFDKGYKKQEIKSKFGLDMPNFFAKWGKHWSSKVNDSDHLYSLLNTLRDLGFNIEEADRNPGLREFLAYKV